MEIIVDKDYPRTRPVIDSIKNMIDLAADMYDIGKKIYKEYKNKKNDEEQDQDSEEPHTVFSIIKEKGDKIIEAYSYSNKTCEVRKIDNEYGKEKILTIFTDSDGIQECIVGS